MPRVIDRHRVETRLEKRQNCPDTRDVIRLGRAHGSAVCGGGYFKGMSADREDGSKIVASSTALFALHRIRSIETKLGM